MICFDEELIQSQSVDCECEIFFCEFDSIANRIYTSRR